VRGGHQHPEPSGGVATAWPPLPPTHLAPSPAPLPLPRPQLPGALNTSLALCWTVRGELRALRFPAWGWAWLRGKPARGFRTVWEVGNNPELGRPRPAPPPRPHPHHHLSLCRTGLHIMEDTCRQPVKMDPTVGAGACAWRAVSHPIFCVPCSSVANNCPPLPPLVLSPTLQARAQLASDYLWTCNFRLKVRRGVGGRPWDPVRCCVCPAPTRPNRCGVEGNGQAPETALCRKPSPRALSGGRHRGRGEAAAAAPTLLASH